MSTFHAFFSVGGLAGAGLAALVLARGMGDVAHVIGVALGLAVLALAALPTLPTVGQEAQPGGPAISLPTGPLLGLGVLAFFCLVAEGAMAAVSDPRMEVQQARSQPLRGIV